MTDDTASARQQRYEAQTTEQFAALGRFVQGFEQILFSMRFNLMFFFGNRTSLETQLLDILLSHKTMTAAPLMQVQLAFVGELLKFAEDKVCEEDRVVVQGVLTQTSREFEALSNLRNNLLHGSWFIGWANPADEDFSEFKVHKTKLSKAGRGLEALPKTARELDALTARCKALDELNKGLVALLVMRLHMGEDPGLRRNYEKVGGRWQRKYAAPVEPSEPAP